MKLNGEDFFWVVSGSAYYPFWKISVVLVRVPFVVLKHYDQKHVEAGRVYLACTYGGKPS